MTQIDEKAFREALNTAMPHMAEAYTQMVLAYESARAPRTITREELSRDIAEYFEGYEELTRYNCKKYAEAAIRIMVEKLATLGITVEGE